jgi:hypothetical protein
VVRVDDKAKWADAAAHLEADPDPEVREVFQRSKVERRSRALSHSYLSQVLAACREGTEGVLREFRCGRALPHFGDDETIRALEQSQRNADAKPHIRYWIGQIIGELKKQWDNRTTKWPDPWLGFEGAVEAVRGSVLWPDGSLTQAQGHIWSQRAATPSGVSEWGGALTIDEGLRTPETVSLLLHGRREARAVVKNINDSGLIVFSGTGAFPDQLRPSHGPE